MSLTAAEKLRVVHALDELGVHMIEAGFPASNPKEQELFRLLADEQLGVAEIVAFGMTRPSEISAERDEGLRVLAECFAPICTLVWQGLGAACREGRARPRARRTRDDRRLGRIFRLRGQSACCSMPSILRRLKLDARLCARLPARGCLRRALSGSCCAIPTEARCHPRSAPPSRS